MKNVKWLMLNGVSITALEGAVAVCPEPALLETMEEMRTAHPHIENIVVSEISIKIVKTQGIFTRPEQAKQEPPTLAEIQKALDFHPSPPVVLQPGEKIDDWDIVSKHIQRPGRVLPPEGE